MRYKRASDYCVAGHCVAKNAFIGIHFPGARVAASEQFAQNAAVGANWGSTARLAMTWNTQVMSNSKNSLFVERPEQDFIERASRGQGQVLDVPNFQLELHKENLFRNSRVAILAL